MTIVINAFTQLRECSIFVAETFEASSDSLNATDSLIVAPLSFAS